MLSPVGEGAQTDGEFGRTKGGEAKSAAAAAAEPASPAICRPRQTLFCSVCVCLCRRAARNGRATPAHALIVQQRRPARPAGQRYEWAAEVCLHSRCFTRAVGPALGSLPTFLTERHCPMPSPKQTWQVLRMPKRSAIPARTPGAATTFVLLMCVPELATVPISRMPGPAMARCAASALLAPVASLS